MRCPPHYSFFFNLMGNAAPLNTTSLQMEIFLLPCQKALSRHLNQEKQATQATMNHSLLFPLLKRWTCPCPSSSANPVGVTNILRNSVGPAATSISFCYNTRDFFAIKPIFLFVSNLHGFPPPPKKRSCLLSPKNLSQCEWSRFACLLSLLKLKTGFSYPASFKIPGEWGQVLAVILSFSRRILYYQKEKVIGCSLKFV